MNKEVRANMIVAALGAYCVFAGALVVQTWPNPTPNPPEKIPAPTSPLESVDPPEYIIATSLEKRRWSCEEKGCLNRKDIERLGDAIVDYSKERNLDPWWVVGVIRTENPWLDSTRVSYRGAEGLLQVIPLYWGGMFPECASHTSVRGSVCVGTRILETYLMANNGDRHRALLDYNGCHNPAHKCNNYPHKVTKRGVE